MRNPSWATDRRCQARTQLVNLDRLVHVGGRDALDAGAKKEIAEGLTEGEPLTRRIAVRAEDGEQRCALAAICWWGWQPGRSTASRRLLAVGGVVLLSVVWGVFRSESDAIVEVPRAVRILIEVVAFGAATAALVAVGRTRLAAVFAVVAGVNEILEYVLS